MTGASLAAAAALLLLAAAAEEEEDVEFGGSGCEEGSGPPLRLQVTSFNFETVQVAWDALGSAGTNLTLVYLLDAAEGAAERDARPCERYLRRGGRTVGCLLRAGDAVLTFAVRDGTRTVFSASCFLADHLKPATPKDLHFQWAEDAVVVTCSELPYRGLTYEVQHRGPQDGEDESEWQSRETDDSCNVTVPDLDVRACRSFRARVKTQPTHYGPGAVPSDWTPVVHWRGGQLADACPAVTADWPATLPKFVLPCALLALLALGLLLLLTVWKAQRLKARFMPKVPDAKGTFPGLFDRHHGDFQEWIMDRQHVAPWPQPDGDLEDSTPVVQLTQLQPESPPGTDPVDAPARDTEAPREALPDAPRVPQEGDVVALGGFTFVVTDGAYIRL